MTGFNGKVAIVTGAAGDIGQTTARRFAAEGASVVLVDAKADALRALALDMAATGASVRAVPADVSSEPDVQAYVQAATDTFGGVDILFNNAGIESESTDISECDLDDFDRVMAVNVRGVLLGIKHVVPAMRLRDGGSIVNTASVAGLSGAGALISYRPSTFAVVGLTRSAAIQQGPHNIRVNAVCPSAMNGRMKSSIEQRLLPDDPAAAHTLVEQTIPRGRYARPADVASMVTYLCSDEASFLTGGTYTVDGGVTA